MKEFNAMLNILFTLRQKCPSDKARSSEQVLKYLKEEIDEIEKAINNNDKENIIEELGDTLWTLMFLMKCQSEEYGFEIPQVLQKINNKLIFRHPHVFKEPREVTKEEAEQIWKEQKAKEKELKLVH